MNKAIFSDIDLQILEKFCLYDFKLPHNVDRFKTFVKSFVLNNNIYHKTLLEIYNKIYDVPSTLFSLNELIDRIQEDENSEFISKFVFSLHSTIKNIHGSIFLNSNKDTELCDYTQLRISKRFELSRKMKFINCKDIKMLNCFFGNLSELHLNNCENIVIKDIDNHEFSKIQVNNCRKILVSDLSYSNRIIDITCQDDSELVLNNIKLREMSRISISNCDKVSISNIYLVSSKIDIRTNKGEEIIFSNVFINKSNHINLYGYKRIIFNKCIVKSRLKVSKNTKLYVDKYPVSIIDFNRKVDDIINLEYKYFKEYLLKFDLDYQNFLTNVYQESGYTTTVY